jgi:hypothetical protein
MANLVNFRKNGYNVKKTNEKKSGVKHSFVMSNKHFFHGSHESLTIISKSNFLNYYSKLTYSQRVTLYCFVEALNNDEVYSCSEIKYTKKDKLSYITATFSYKGESYTQHIFYFYGLNKLLSLRGKAKFKLNLKQLLK